MFNIKKKVEKKSVGESVGLGQVLSKLGDLDIAVGITDLGQRERDAFGLLVELKHSDFI